MLRAMERFDHVRSDPLDAVGLAELFSPHGGVVGLDTPAARFALVRRVLGHLGPTVLVLENAHWSAEAVRFARDLLAREGAAIPLLLVLSFDPALADEPGRRAMAGLGAETLPLGELAEGPGERLALGLGLEPALAKRVVGGPLLRVETVRWWLQQGALEPGPDGRRAAREVRAPESLDALWRARADRVLQGHPDWRPLLGVLAVLGVEVETVHWVRACEALGREAQPALLDALSAAGLIRRDDERIELAHPTLRAALVRGADDARRLHAAAARAVDDPAVQGRHFLAADDGASAVEPLFRAAELARQRGEYDDAERILDLHRHALGAIPRSDPRWGLAAVRRATHCQVRKDLDGMGRWIARALEDAQAHTWKEAEASARLKLSALHRLRGDLASAWREALAAETIARHLEDPRLARRAVYEKIQVTARMGLIQDSLKLSELYLRQTVEGPDQGTSVARAWLLVASAHARLGVDGSESLKNAREAATKSGERFILASCAVIRGEAARKGGNALEALAHYREAERTLELLGHGDVGIARLNIACCELDLGGRPEALLRELLAGPGGVLLRMGSLAALLACLADRPDGELEQILEELEGSPLTDTDFARYAELAAERATEVTRQRRLLAYAAVQRSRLTRR
ncbi:MAG: hypothetical protein GY884_10340 [Proteobacteria bacterium]|nr:hypothetical protein [Pseudomonadota bacterium]